MFKPQFQITNQILQNIAEIEASRQIIENAPLIPAWERQFREDAIVRQVHHSTAIEGNALNYTEAKNILDGKKIDSVRKRDIREILNYRKCIDFISKNESKDLSLEFFLKINSILLEDILSQESGKLRNRNVVLMSSKTQSVVMEPTPWKEVEGEVEDLIIWYNDSESNINPILKAGILLHEITRIHPFIDGNGRTSRLLATWSLYKDAYDIKKFFSLEEYYDQDSKAFYEALASADDGEISQWLEYFTRGLAVELGRVKNKILDISRDVKVRRTIGQVALNERQIVLIKFIEENGALKNQDFKILFPDVSDDTILRDLKDLMEKKIVKKSGSTKGASYRLV